MSPSSFLLLTASPSPNIMPTKKDKPSFLELPLEVRHMIYNELLPDTVRLGRRYYFNLPILQTSRTVYKEALQLMRCKTVLSLNIKDRESHLVSLWWINNLGDDLVSKIRYLEIGSCLEVWRNGNTAHFRRCILSFLFGTGPSGITVRYMMPDSVNDLVISYSSGCLTQRPRFPDYLQQMTLGIVRDQQDIKMGTRELNLIMEATLMHSEYGYLCDPTARDIVRTERPRMHYWKDYDLQFWTYIHPATVSFY
ncbi:MAG: hypothetical protein LQ338_000969 [Usnochroma carphineum]|nr:MAG: hypothetical protein LQ338_000969 [Usnochroma carphineum]